MFLTYDLIFNMFSNMMDATSGAETAYSSGSP